MMPKLRPFLLALTASVSACAGGTETGNPPFTATLSYAAYSSDESVSLRSTGASRVVQSVWLDLADVSLRADPACGSSRLESTPVPALGIGDHAAGAHNFTSFEGRVERYCALDLPMLRAPNSAGAPPDYAGLSVLLTGTLADGTPYRVASRVTPTLRLAADRDSFELSAAESHLLVAFDVAAWLAGVDLESAERSADGISVSETENPALLRLFEANLASGVALYRDAGDGKWQAASERIAHAE